MHIYIYSLFYFKIVKYERNNDIMGIWFDYVISNASLLNRVLISLVILNRRAIFTLSARGTVSVH